MIKLLTYAAAYEQRLLSLAPATSEAAAEDELALALRAAGVSVEETQRYLANAATERAPFRNAA